MQKSVEQQQQQQQQQPSVSLTTNSRRFSVHITHITVLCALCVHEQIRCRILLWQICIIPTPDRLVYYICCHL